VPGRRWNRRGFGQLVLLRGEVRQRLFQSWWGRMGGGGRWIWCGGRRFCGVLR